MKLEQIKVGEKYTFSLKKKTATITGTFYAK